MINNMRDRLSTGDKDFSQVLKHSFWGFAVLALATSLQFFFDLLLARNFGAEGAGIFYLSLSVLAIAALISRLGFDKTVIRFLPPLMSRKKWPEVRGLISSIIKMVSFNALILTVAIYLLAPLMAKAVFSNPELTQYIRILALGILPFSLTYVYAGILRGMKLIKEALFIERAFVYLGGIIAIVTLGLIYGIIGLFWGFLVSIYIAAGAGLIVAKRQIPYNKTLVPFDKKVLLLSATPLFFSAFSNLMFGQVSVLALGALASLEDVGVFNIALKVSLLMGLVLVGINSISGTKISELHADKKNLQSLAGKTAALSLTLAIPLLLIFILVPEFILGLFGPEFTNGAAVLIILAIGQLFSVGVGSANYILAMTGYENILAKIMFSTLIINAVLSLVLIPIYGIIGAGIAVTVSMVINSIIQVLVIKNRLDIWSLPFNTISSWIKSSLASRN
ncbi:MAG: flippase [Candidatus Saccharimonadales bacterium]